MNGLYRFHLLSLIGVCLLLGKAVPVDAQTVRVEAAKVIMAKGDAYTQTLGGDKSALKRRSTIYVGDTLVTGKDAIIQIRFTDRALMTLREETVFYIEEYVPSDSEKGGKALMQLLAGGLRTMTGAIGKDSADEYSVRTNAGSIGIRGTFYDAVMLENDSLSLATWEGEVLVSNDSGSLAVGPFQAHQYASIAPNQAPKGSLTPPQGITVPDEYKKPQRKTPRKTSTGASNEESETSGQTEEGGTQEQSKASDSTANNPEDQKNGDAGTASEQSSKEQSLKNHPSKPGSPDTASDKGSQNPPQRTPLLKPDSENPPPQQPGSVVNSVGGTGNSPQGPNRMANRPPLPGAIEGTRPLVGNGLVGNGIVGNDLAGNRPVNGPGLLPLSGPLALDNFGDLSGPLLDDAPLPFFVELLDNPQILDLPLEGLNTETITNNIIENSITEVLNVDQVQVDQRLTQAERDQLASTVRFALINEIKTETNQDQTVPSALGLALNGADSNSVAILAKVDRGSDRLIEPNPSQTLGFDLYRKGGATTEQVNSNVENLGTVGWGIWNGTTDSGAITEHSSTNDENPVDRAIRLLWVVAEPEIETPFTGEAIFEVDSARLAEGGFSENPFIAQSSLGSVESISARFNIDFDNARMIGDSNMSLSFDNTRIDKIWHLDLGGQFLNYDRGQFSLQVHQDQVPTEAYLSDDMMCTNCINGDINGIILRGGNEAVSTFDLQATHPDTNDVEHTNGAVIMKREVP